MTSFLQLLVAVGTAAFGAVIALYWDKAQKEREQRLAQKEDERQAHLDFHDNNDKFDENRVAMSRTQL